MRNRASLTVGHIPYLNCVPCFQYLKETGFTGDLVSGVPSTLNSLLQQGLLDVSPSSSFEYARNWQDYVLLPGHSISSYGKVESVLLFTPVNLKNLAGKNIGITGESATSINLLRIILREFFGVQGVTDAVPEQPVEELVAQGQPALLIGDRALKLASAGPPGMLVIDLGEIWLQQTGLPFVFALWMIRRAALDDYGKELSLLSWQLKESYRRVMSDPLPIAVAEEKRTGLDQQQIIDYWKSIDYRLENEHIKGLKLFFQLCQKHGLLKAVPSLDFFQPDILNLEISG